MFKHQFTRSLSVLSLAFLYTTLQADSLHIQIGQMIMVGINERTKIQENDSLLKEIADHKVGGVVLFEKNISPSNSATDLKTLIANLQSKAPMRLLVTIDEEGGKVHRLKEKYGFVAMPSASYLGTLDKADSTLF